MYNIKSLLDVDEGRRRGLASNDVYSKKYSNLEEAVIDTRNLYYVSTT